jgi:serine O-acetyltransferase
VGNRVAIGAGAAILGPVTIGDDAVIGALSVVLDNIPAGALAVGIPAKVKKSKKRTTST